MAKITVLEKLNLDQHAIYPYNKERLKKHYARPAPELQGVEKLTATTHQEYTDDAILCLEPKCKQEIITPPQNYKIVTKGRKIPIQWKKQKY